MSSICKDFADKVNKKIKNDKTLKELDQKQKSKEIVTAISILKSAIFVNVLKDFDKKGKSIDFGNLKKDEAKELKDVAPIYKGIVRAIEKANLILGKNYSNANQKAKENDFAF